MPLNLDKTAEQASKTDTKLLHEKVAFGHFVFSPQQDELLDTIANTKIKLEPQISSLLQLLIINKGQVISREHIHQNLWGGTVVEENSLYQLLTKLRKLLGESSRSPLYVKTIPKKGYCFIGDIMDVSKSDLKHEDKSSIHTIDTHIKFNKLADYKKTSLFLIILLVPFSILFNNWLSPISSTHDDEANYESQSISFQLGLEADINAHQSADYLAYIKDLYSLHITDKKGKNISISNDNFRLAKPSWHPNNRQLAYWRYVEDKCQLIIVTPMATKNHTSPSIECELVKHPIWLTEDIILVVLKQGNNFIAYEYTISSRNYSLYPLPIKTEQGVKDIVVAWHNEIYILVNHEDNSSSLLSTDNEEVMHWSFPVWLIAYNPKSRTIITNDQSQRHGLLATDLSGNTQRVSHTANGAFTDISIDAEGDIYVVLESWQVNMYDKQGLSLLSTSSWDYLPVTNKLGETAFMSLRDNNYQIFLSAHNKLNQLSHFKNHEDTKFLEWSPAATLLLANQGGLAYFYDKQGEISQFKLALNNKIKNIGWIDQQHIFAYDGQQLSTYNLQGQKLTTVELLAQAIYYDVNNKQWLVIKEHQLFLTTDVANTSTPYISFLPKQLSQLNNIRIHNNTLYWKTLWNQQDRIWSLFLSDELTTKEVKVEIKLEKEGHLIWNFDINPAGDINVSKMESIEGDIIKFKDFN